MGILMLFGLMFIFPVCSYLQATPKSDIQHETIESIRQYWSSLVQAMITLFMAITGGNDWIEFAAPLKVVDPVFYYVFVSYIFFACVSLLNILTGIFVNSALKVEDKNDRALREVLEKQGGEILEMFTNHFENLTNDGTGALPIEIIMKDFYHPDVQPFFALHGLDCNHAYAVHKALMHHNDFVGLDSFILACKRAGSDTDTKASDILAVLSEGDRTMSQPGHFMRYCEERFNHIDSHFERLSGVKVTVVEPLLERLSKHRCAPPHWAGQKQYEQFPGSRQVSGDSGRVSCHNPQLSLHGGGTSLA